MYSTYSYKQVPPYLTHPPQQRSSGTGPAVLYSAPTTTGHRGPRCPSNVASGAHMGSSAMRIVGTLVSLRAGFILTPSSRWSIQANRQPVVRPPDRSELLHMQRIVRLGPLSGSPLLRRNMRMESFTLSLRLCCLLKQMTLLAVSDPAGATSQ
jgi:hypothetical protein